MLGLKGKSYKFKKCSTYNAGSLNNCFFNLTGRNKPLETYKNPFSSNNEKVLYLFFLIIRIISSEKVKIAINLIKI